MGELHIRVGQALQQFLSRGRQSTVDEVTGGAQADLAVQVRPGRKPPVKVRYYVTDDVSEQIAELAGQQALHLQRQQVRELNIAVPLRLFQPVEVLLASRFKVAQQLVDQGGRLELVQVALAYFERRRPGDKVAPGRRRATHLVVLTGDLVKVSQLPVQLGLFGRQFLF